MLSEAPDIDRIALSDVRNLREAQRGNAMALQALIRPHLSGIWTICRRFHTEEQGAIDEVLAFRDTLASEIRRLTVEDAFGLQLYGLLWRHLMATVEPSRRRGIELPGPKEVLHAAATPLTEAMLSAALHAVDPFSRLVYLFWATTGLSSPRLARLIGESEPRVRLARSQVALRIHKEASR